MQVLALVDHRLRGNISTLKVFYYLLRFHLQKYLFFPKKFLKFLEWFFCSTLLSKIELKVEHWQVSSQAGHGTTGVYTAGIDFSRYDNIVRDFPDSKLTKVINVSRRILQNPTKNALQKLGQDLIAETGFDEHLYFTD